MASKFQQKIKLMKKDDEGKYKSVQFTSAEFLPGAVLDEALQLNYDLEHAARLNDVEELRPVMRKIYDFIADVVFEGQFTGEEYFNGMDAREVMKITQNILMSVTAGYDSVYTSTKKK